MNHKQKERRAAMLKLGNRCNDPDCPMPYNEHWGLNAFQFDHIEPPNRVGWTKRQKDHARNMICRSIMEGDPNIQMLCANCHAAKSVKNGDYLQKHRRVSEG